MITLNNRDDLKAFFLSEHETLFPKSDLRQIEFTINYEFIKIIIIDKNHFKWVLTITYYTGFEQYPIVFPYPNNEFTLFGLHRKQNTDLLETVFKEIKYRLKTKNKYEQKF